jgi:RNA-directed DNA polymerase
VLSNLVLDEFDRELTHRGLRFCRYADDGNIDVGSRRAGERVMKSACRFWTTRRQLKVNESKSAVARSGERKFLGFTISNDPEPIRQIAAKALEKFRDRVRELTSRTLGVSLPQLIAPLARYLIGWRGYFGFCQTPIVVRNLDAWIRRRLRMYIWRQWKNGRTRYAPWRRLGVSHFHAAVAAGSEPGYWRMARHVTVQQALSNASFDSLGLPRLTTSPNAELDRTAVVRTRMPGGVGGEEPRGSPLSRSTGWYPKGRHCPGRTRSRAPALRIQLSSSPVL